MDEELDDEGKPKKLSRAAIARRVLVGVLLAATVGGWVWSRYLVDKAPLGGPCSWAIHCSKEAPTCMRPDIEAPGVCSRPCAVGADCAPGIRCIEVELDERDEHGERLKSGTCVPQTFLDARKPKRDGGVEVAAAKDSWVDVPEAAGQLEGEITFVTERAGTKATERTVLVKGALVRGAPPATDGASRRIVDTSTMRVYVVDDAKQRFQARALGGAADPVTVTKTEKKERVADHACEVWSLEERGTKREVCVVHGSAFVDPSADVAPAWARELAVRSALALRVVEVDAKGREVSRTTATRFEDKTLPRPLFAVPRAYKNAASR